MKRLSSIYFLILAILTFLLNWPECCEWIAKGELFTFAWREYGYRGNSQYTDAYRELVNQFAPFDGDVYYCCDASDGRLQPAERSVHLALSWELCPTPVRFGSVDDVDDADVIVISRFRRVRFHGYRSIAENDYAALWLRDGIPAPKTSRTLNVGPLREMAGVIFLGFSALGIGGLFLCRGGLWFQGGWWCLLGFVAIVFVVTGGLALTHTFVAPTGLGIYGGKAKLLFFHGGVPPDFFTAASYSTFQPAYPPGLALLTLVSYLVSGCCGEWLTQLISVIAMALLATFLFSRTDLTTARLLILAAMLTPVSLRLSSYYYAEPIVALFILVGWERIRDRNGKTGDWVLMGIAGLFKNEGCVLFAICWTAIRLTDGRRRASWFGLVAGLALPFAWHVGCRLVGGTLYDFAAPWNPDVMRLWITFCMVVREMLLCPWRYAFVCPLMLVLLAARPFWVRLTGKPPMSLPELYAATFVLGLSVVSFAYILSLSRAPDFYWHLSTSLPRLLWAPSILLLYESVRAFEMFFGNCVPKVAKVAQLNG